MGCMRMLWVHFWRHHYSRRLDWFSNYYALVCGIHRTRDLGMEHRRFSIVQYFWLHLLLYGCLQPYLNRRQSLRCLVLYFMGYRFCIWFFNLC